MLFRSIKTPFGEFDGPGVADLKENKDGVWEFTTPEPLKPELYSLMKTAAQRSVSAMPAGVERNFFALLR